MRIVLGSENQPKLRSVEAAFSAVFKDQIITETCAAESGVSSHPTTAEESLEGAINRAKNAQKLLPGADYYVGIEGGFMTVGERVWELGWVAVQDANDVIHTAPSAGVEIGGKVLDAILGGQELNDVLKDQFGINNAGKTNGYYGVVTDDVVNREQGYRDAIIFALAPFQHPEFYK